MEASVLSHQVINKYVDEYLKEMGYDFKNDSIRDNYFIKHTIDNFNGVRMSIVINIGVDYCIDNNNWRNFMRITAKNLSSKDFNLEQSMVYFNRHINLDDFKKIYEGLSMEFISKFQFKQI